MDAGLVVCSEVILRFEAPVTAKDTVRALLDRLPDDCSLDDVQYHLYVVQAVGRGLADGEVGRRIPHEQVTADLRRKWQQPRASLPTPAWDSAAGA